MKQNKFFLNAALAVVMGVAALVCVLLRTFAPAVILPVLDIPAMVLLSLIALVTDHYVAGKVKRCYICIPVLAAVTFGLLPYVSGFAVPCQALWFGLIGGVVFTLITLLYSSIQDRLSSGPAAKAAPVLSAFCLYLAAQCFAGIL